MTQNSISQLPGGRLFVAEETSKHQAAGLAEKPEGLALLGRKLEVQIENFAENVFTRVRVFQVSDVDIDVHAIEKVLAENDADFFTLDESAGLAKRLDVFDVQQEAEVAAKLGKFMRIHGAKKVMNLLGNGSLRLVPLPADIRRA